MGATMKKVSKIGVISYARLQTVIFGIVGLVAGVLYSFGGLLIDILVTLGLASSVSMSTPGLSFGTVLAFGALIGMPAIFAFVGFSSGVIGAVVYNLYAQRFGGLELDIW